MWLWDINRVILTAFTRRYRAVPWSCVHGFRVAPRLAPKFLAEN